MKPTYEDLVKHLAAVLDGIDGYEAENGNLRYWSQVAVEQAKLALASV